MDELATMIGCKPNPLSYLLSDPVLAYILLFGPNAPYVYRLNGPHPWNGARDALMNLNNRVLHGMRGSEKKQALKSCYGKMCEDKNPIMRLFQTNAKVLLLFFVFIFLSLTFIKWL